MKTSTDEAKVVLGADFHCFFLGGIIFTKRFSIIEFDCIVNHVRNIKSKPTVNAQWAKASILTKTELYGHIARNQAAFLVLSKEGLTNAVNLLAIEELNGLLCGIFGSAFQQLRIVLTTT